MERSEIIAAEVEFRKRRIRAQVDRRELVVACIEFEQGREILDTSLRSDTFAGYVESRSCLAGRGNHHLPGNRIEIRSQSR